MTIGLSKEAIVTKLMGNEDYQAEDLFNKIAEIIVENNKEIEKNVTGIVAKNFSDSLKKRGRGF